MLTQLIIKLEDNKLFLKYLYINFHYNNRDSKFNKHIVVRYLDLKMKFHLYFTFLTVQRKSDYYSLAMGLFTTYLIY